MTGSIVGAETKCGRCGKPCEPGPYRVPLCNGCALELGNREIAARQGRGDVKATPRPVAEPAVAK